jgi:hypothetical protein
MQRLRQAGALASFSGAQDAPRLRPASPGTGESSIETRPEMSEGATKARVNIGLIQKSRLFYIFGRLNLRRSPSNALMPAGSMFGLTSN